MTERFEQQIAELLEIAIPTPPLRPGWQERVLKGVAADRRARAARFGIHAIPERMKEDRKMRMLVVVGLVILVLAVATFAAVSYTRSAHQAAGKAAAVTQTETPQPGAQGGAWGMGKLKTAPQSDAPGSK